MIEDGFSSLELLLRKKQRQSYLIICICIFSADIIYARKKKIERIEIHCVDVRVLQINIRTCDDRKFVWEND